MSRFLADCNKIKQPVRTKDPFLQLQGQFEQNVLLQLPPDYLQRLRSSVPWSTTEKAVVLSISFQGDLNENAVVEVVKDFLDKQWWPTFRFYLEIQRDLDLVKLYFQKDL